MRCSLSFQGTYSTTVEYMKTKLIAAIARMNYTAKTALSCTLLLMGYCSIKKYKNGPCESRSHDLRVISTTLYRLSQRTHTLHRALWIVVCEMEQSFYHMKDTHYSTLIKFVMPHTILLYESTYLFFLKRHK